MATKSILARAWAFVAGALVLTATMSSPSQAGVLILSGDVGIATNSFSALSNPGNQTFLSNILQGGNSVVVQEGSISFAANDLHNFYDGLGTVSSTLLGPGATLTAGTLVGVNLFVGHLPANSYTGAEITVLGDYLTGGGSIFFMGDNTSFPDENNRINAALAALGSAMSIDNVEFESGLIQTAIGAQIAVDQFTAGVNSLQYGTPSSITGGTQIFFGKSGQPFIAYEAMAMSVPEPGTLGLLGLGVLGLGIARQKRMI